MQLLRSKFAPYVIFAAGFLWDVFTLNRIDNPVDNLILGGYLLLASLCLVVSHGVATGRLQQWWVLKYPHLWALGLQFFLGGLFSSYVVYYFRSTTISATLFFILLMTFLLVANEFLPRRLGNVYLQTGLFTIAAFSYFIYLVPVILKVMGPWVFLLSGLISLGLMAAVVMMLVRMTHNEVEFDRRRLWLTSGGVYLAVILLYLGNLIPPIPLAAKDVGMYLGYERNGDTYRLLEADMGWEDVYRFWERRVPYRKGQPVYCFASVFAPTDMPFAIVHHWQYYDEVQKAWTTTDQLKYPANGGRDGGYRGVSFKSAIKPGLWRVDVENARGYVVARVRFRVVDAPASSTYWVER